MPVLTTQATQKQFVHQDIETQKQSSNAPVILRLSSVTKTYANGCHALLDVNLEVKEKEFLFITAPVVLVNQLS